MKQVVGIIGGMGARAGVQVADYLVQEAQKRGALLDSDFPEFVLYNLPTRGMNEFGISDEQIIKEELVNCFHRMENLNCRYVLIACNTVYCFQEDLRKYFSGTLVDMITVTAATLKGNKKAGIISSSWTRDNGFYSRALEKYNIKPIIATDDQQPLLDRAIKAVISGKQTEKHGKDVEG